MAHFRIYRRLLKSTDLVNLEMLCVYFATMSLFVVDHVPPLDFI